MDHIAIRQIRPSDNFQLAAIIRDVFVEFNLPKSGTVYDDDSTDDLFSLLNVPGAVGLVAEVNNIILGSAAIYPTPGLPDGYCEFSKYYIAPAGRGKGIGKMLLSECLILARKMNYKTVYLESFPGLNTALAMYHKLGFRSIDHPLGNSGHLACTIWQVLDL